MCVFLINVVTVNIRCRRRSVKEKPTRLFYTCIPWKNKNIVPHEGVCVCVCRLGVSLQAVLKTWPNRRSWSRLCPVSTCWSPMLCDMSLMLSPTCPACATRASSISVPFHRYWGMCDLLQKNDVVLFELYDMIFDQHRFLHSPIVSVAM